MKTLVVGATGATGRLLVAELLEQGREVSVIVRSPHKLPEDMRANPKLTVVEASLLDLDDKSLAEHVKGCDSIASCLGHNISFKGMYGQPRLLVSDAARRLCHAAKANNPNHSVKYVLMNTAGNSNRDLKEPIPFAQKIVLMLIRLLVPPHVDNERASDHLRVKIGQNDEVIEWVVVRPDGLIDEDAVSEYTVHESPTRSAIFNPGKTSRINVGNFMANLITNDELWATWKGKMPVIYNKEADA